VTQRAEGSRSVAGERAGRSEGPGDAAVFRAERLRLSGMLQVGGTIAGLVGLDRGAVVLAGLEDGIGLALSGRSLRGEEE